VYLSRSDEPGYCGPGSRPRAGGPGSGPLLERLLALGAEVLGQVHLIEVLRKRPHTIGCDHHEAVVRVDEQRDQAVGMAGGEQPADPGLDLALVAIEDLEVADSS
jgi:hypothetical protein